MNIFSQIWWWLKSLFCKKKPKVEEFIIRFRLPDGRKFNIHCIKPLTKSK